MLKLDKITEKVAIVTPLMDLSSDLAKSSIFNPVPIGRNTSKYF
jgi:hypothetical protein